MHSAMGVGVTEGKLVGVGGMVVGAGGVFVGVVGARVGS